MKVWIVCDNNEIPSIRVLKIWKKLKNLLINMMVLF